MKHKLMSCFVWMKGFNEPAVAVPSGWEVADDTPVSVAQALGRTVGWGFAFYHPDKKPTEEDLEVWLYAAIPSFAKEEVAHVLVS